MKKVQVNKAYSYSLNGYEVLTAGVGQHELDDKVAGWIVADGHGEYVEDKKAAPAAPENKAETAKKK